MKKVRSNQLFDLTAAGLTKQSLQSQDGRLLNVSGQQKIDYVTTNYLGWDFHPRLLEKGTEYHRQWGSLSGWSRLEVDPEIYQSLEHRIAQFLGCKEVVLSHTITITNFSIIPSITKHGTIFCDQKVHTVVWEACRLARDHGATLARFEHQNLADLEAKLQQCKQNGPKLICVDGVYSISSEYAPIPELQALCQKYGAWLLVDDAHGFGILGRNPRKNSYGNDGSGVCNYFHGDFKRTFYVASFGKSFCNHTAFVTMPDEYPESLRESCLQYIYSAPMSPFVIGAVDASLDLNVSEGNEQRQRLYQRTEQLFTGMRKLGLRVSNNKFFPIVFWEIGSLQDLTVVAKNLFSSGVLAGLRAYPVVPENECGLRFGITSLHTFEQIERTLELLEQALRTCGQHIRIA
jgi:8-amino-7-oxononanoate synthase